jgi:hypothetical protein
MSPNIAAHHHNFAINMSHNGTRPPKSALANRCVMKAQLLIAGIVFSSFLVAGPSSFARTNMPICESQGHASYCKRLEHRHRKHRLVGHKSNRKRMQASHQVEGYYDGGSSSWSSSAAREYQTPPAAGYLPAPAGQTYLPPPPPPVPGPSFNFYGPTTNYFGPTFNYGADYRQPSEPIPDDRDRMNPWHGYNGRNGLQNGY